MFNSLIKKYIFIKKKNIVIAYSGGVDSTILLFLLMKYREKYPNLFIKAIHINHNINTLSNKWSLHCIKQCKIWNIDLIIKNIYIKKYNKLGLEATARLLRYRYFNKILNNNEILFTGHHIEDLSESFFLALKRGSGPRGLISIKFKRKINNLIVISPMLYWSKKKILYLANKYNLKWIEDPSNDNIYFDRNYLRKNILPYLRNKWYNIDKLIARTSYLCNLQEKCLKLLIKPIYKRIINNNILFIKKFLFINSKSIKYIIIRFWIIKITKIIPTFINIHNIYKNIIFNKNINILDFKNFILKKNNNKLFLLKININKI